MIAASAVGLRVALAAGHWDSYGALQLPLVFEAVAAAAIAVSTASPFGEPERVAGRWLPVLRLAAALALTALAAGLLAAAGAGTQLAGGSLDVLRNVAGITGLGLLGAAVLGGGLAWTGPVAYLLAGLYALYTQWHPPALSTPWLWPARPPHDLGGALCAGLVFLAGRPSPRCAAPATRPANECAERAPDCRWPCVSSGAELTPRAGARPGQGGRAMGRGDLPADGEPRLGPVQLPPGRRIVPWEGRAAGRPDRAGPGRPPR